MTEKAGWQPEQGEHGATGADDDMAQAQQAQQQTQAPLDDEDRSTIDVLRLLVSEGRDYASNEIERQKLRASIIGKATRDAAILGVVALFLLMGALIAALIGFIMALAPHVGGPLPATGIVIGGSLLTILLLLLLARMRVGKALRQIKGPEESE
ncbi:MAG: hypothetical protein AB7E05_05620 [Sphingobium sp.]